MQSGPKISLVTLVVAVAALVLALWPVVADAPWENGLTEQEIYETIWAEADAKADADAVETEAERLAKCRTITRLATLGKEQGGILDPLVAAEFTRASIENHCW